VHRRVALPSVALSRWAQGRTGGDAYATFGSAPYRRARPWRLRHLAKGIGSRSAEKTAHPFSSPTSAIRGTSGVLTLKLHEIPEKPEPEIEHAAPGVADVLLVNLGEKSDTHIV
jgi:hypothetical protein